MSRAIRCDAQNKSRNRGKRADLDVRSDCDNNVGRAAQVLEYVRTQGEVFTIISKLNCNGSRLSKAARPGSNLFGTVSIETSNPRAAR